MKRIVMTIAIFVSCYAYQINTFDMHKIDNALAQAAGAPPADQSIATLDFKVLVDKAKTLDAVAQAILGFLQKADFEGLRKYAKGTLATMRFMESLQNIIPAANAMVVRVTRFASTYAALQKLDGAIRPFVVSSMDRMRKLYGSPNDFIGLAGSVGNISYAADASSWIRPEYIDGLIKRLQTLRTGSASAYQSAVNSLQTYYQNTVKPLADQAAQVGQADQGLIKQALQIVVNSLDGKAEDYYDEKLQNVANNTDVLKTTLPRATSFIVQYVWVIASLILQLDTALFPPQQNSFRNRLVAAMGSEQRVTPLSGPTFTSLNNVKNIGPDLQAAAADFGTQANNIIGTLIPVF